MSPGGDANFFKILSNFCNSLIFIKVKRIFTVASVKDCKQQWHLFHEVSLPVVTFFDEVFKSI